MDGGPLLQLAEANDVTAGFSGSPVIDPGGNGPAPAGR
jgi:hypothetical protein